MLISRPALSIRNGEVVVEAAVRVEKARGAVPETLWFAFPERFASWATTRGDGFLSALLPLAMYNGEPLTIDADVSTRLFRGLRDHQAMQSAWKDFMHRIDVQCAELVERDPADQAGATITTFSGGVDSFHTLWSHLPQNEPLEPYRITHCMTINGFDGDSDHLNEPGHFGGIERLYADLMKRLGLELISVRTNLLQFIGNHVLKQAFPTFLAAPPLILGKLAARLYIPSSYQFLDLGSFSDGSHPALDHLISTESLETIHDSGDLTRVQKTVAISKWPETWDLLRVCFESTGLQPGKDVVANCCTCEKCVRTMTTLEAAGALTNYRSFPIPYSSRLSRRIYYGPLATRVFANEIIAYARSRGRHDIVRDLRTSIRRSLTFRAPIRELMLASYRLEQRRPLWAKIVRQPKRLVKRLGLGMGWLYTVRSRYGYGKR
jgi:hypothetical protein